MKIFNQCICQGQCNWLQTPKSCMLQMFISAVKLATSVLGFMGSLLGLMGIDVFSVQVSI